ncbi:MAG: hypothetical protein FWG37_00690, partial [Clostridia bacterium]|nr:hypothetical protein [Clostridia bacterium]
MSDRAAMKRRVRGLLYRKWQKPLCALILAVLPLAAAFVFIALSMRSFGSGVRSVIDQIGAVFTEFDDLKTAIYVLMFQNDVDLTVLIDGLPAFAVASSAYLFVGMPIFVSVSEYFLAFLRGKDPKVTDVFSCFSGKYPHALGGMAHRLMWTVIWGLTAFVVPFALYTIGFRILPNFRYALGFYQVPIMIGLIVLCIIWFVVFLFLFFN